MSLSILKAWSAMETKPLGKWLFSKLVCLKAPYFSTIKPRFVALRPGYCEVTMRNRRAVHNHLGTLHAIAQCNLAELCAGVMADATVPHQSHRWIPKGMSVRYLRKITGDVRGIAEIDLPRQWPDKMELIVPVRLLDERGETVFTAEINVYVSAKKAAA